MKFSPMHLFDQLLLAGPTWLGVTITVAAIVLVHVLRQFLPRTQSSRGKVTLLWFYLALGFRLSAAIALNGGAYTIWVLLSFLDLISCALGVIGLVRLVILDLGINRARIRIPLIVSDLVHLGVVLIVLLVILYQHGLDPLSLVTTSAVLTAIVGLALQGTIANVFAGLALHTDKTIGIGDWVQIGSLTGRITEIKWRSTALWTEDGDLVIVPNSRLLDSEVQNLSRPDDVQRMTINIGFHYRHPPNEVKRVLLEVVSNVPGVRTDPTPDCVLRDFADSSITYALRYWISDYTNHMKIESDVRTRLWYAARRAGLEIPFPTHTLHLASTPHTARVMRDNDHHKQQLMALTQANLFNSVAPDARSTLAEQVQILEFGAGEIIFATTTANCPLHLIQQGEVEVFVVVGTVRRLVASLKAGACFGGMLSPIEDSSLMVYTARTDVTCGVIDDSVMAHLLATQPQLAEDFSASLAFQGTAHQESLAGLASETQTHRTAETKSRLLASLRHAFRFP